MTALGLTLIIVYGISAHQTFLLEQGQKSNREVQLARIIYEEARNYRLHEGAKHITREQPIKSKIVFQAEQGAIQKVGIEVKGKVVLEIEKNSEVSKLYSD
ncbi:hypothetical protein PF023_06520 [Enterococcus thailandicus]|uniref:hypothetical protein n=1 Tax=Enterococcus thailandicus TaxID=417368 RepID=UPI0022EBAB2C|nr:hypothetical protein [Enterococcus thailandicus]MDA3973693.1 hypothetical protein [Enterococcus thailandicus]MDA3976493.1 hypothetical protein [Enterococcus thailandicus]MDA3981459.1 hypothetical protein [Enterococcus thailandicus]